MRRAPVATAARVWPDVLVSNETPDRVHAGGQFVPVVALPFTTQIVNQQGIQAFERVAIGQYLLTLQRPLAFAEGYAEAALPANFQAQAAAQISADGLQVVVSVLAMGTGEPIDPPFFACTVWSVQLGRGNGPAPSPAPPPAALPGAGAAPSAQVFWDQPGVSPMAGALSAFAMFPPSPDNVGVVDWTVWFAIRPAAGDSALLRLFRFRYNAGYQVTQISDGFVIDSTSAFQVYNLANLLRPVAADFSEAVNQDHVALSVQLTGGFTMRALNQRITFGPAATGVAAAPVPAGPPLWPAP